MNKKLTLVITDIDHAKIKIEAAKRNISMKDLIMSCVRNELCKLKVSIH